MRKRPQQGADQEQRRAGGLAALPLGPRCVSSRSRVLTRRQVLPGRLCGCTSGLLCGKRNSASSTRGGTTHGAVPDPSLGTGQPRHSQMYDVAGFDFPLWYTHQGCELGIPLLNNHVALDSAFLLHTPGWDQVSSLLRSLLAPIVFNFYSKFCAGTFLHLKGIYSALGEADHGCLNGF